MNYWRNFIDQHFVDDGAMRITLRDQKEDRSKQFEVVASLLPRYFWTQFDGNVEQIQLLLEGTSEKTVNNNYHYVQAERARMLYWFSDGGQVCSAHSSNMHPN